MKNASRHANAQLTGPPAFPVFAWEPDHFFYKVVDAQVHFERNEEGDVDAVVLHEAGEQRTARATHALCAREPPALPTLPRLT